MPNQLTTHAGLKLGPIFLETFFKHYLERNSNTNEGRDSVQDTNLRHDDLLWQEAFEIVKSFLNQATKHTVEELQEFSNARIPSPPWIWVDRVLVPMSSCDAAATYLIKALGGEAFTKRVVGGTKWWQVRGLHGIDCQWIRQKSHMQEARKPEKAKVNNGNQGDASSCSPHLLSHRSRKIPMMNSHADSSNGTEKSPGQTEEESESEKAHTLDSTTDIDETRCMLYAHGGGYYFGSIDQERYCMQRYARKIHGRVFAVNYRLAPQYPFPCAIQDMLAAYLYLIDPPSDARHKPIPPQLIVLAGDSAGGGLCLATLQVIRDSGLPLPAAAVLISPWCDLTHSFPSIIQNTDTDIIPPHGLCLHKPSVLWPPPPDELASKVRAGLRARFTRVAKRAAHVETAFSREASERFPAIGNKHSDMIGDEPSRNIENSQTREATSKPTSKDNDARCTKQQRPGSPSSSSVLGDSGDMKDDALDVRRVAGKPPLPWQLSDSFELVVDGQTVTIDSQIQLYCPNSLLTHPLISPALGYLGGLPPLLVIASDKEVLRDEIIYMAHKAAYPDRFPVSKDSRVLYPPLHKIEEQYRPTPVHLQVYDETAHVLPLFAFTTPAKYCYRAIALFVKHLTSPPEATELLIPSAIQTATPENEEPPTTSEDVTLPSTPHLSASESEPYLNTPGSKDLSTILRSPTSLFRRRTAAGTKSRQPFGHTLGLSSDIPREDSGDVAGHRFKANESQPQGPGTAGDPDVYSRLQWPLQGTMVRERVSTNGALRPLESESEIPALNINPDHIGKINEAAARRYLEGTSMWAKRFAKAVKKIETRRQKNLDLAKGEAIHTLKTMAQLQEHLFREQDNLEANTSPRGKMSAEKHQKEKLKEKAERVGRGSWSWGWVLDDERPPPSSIVSRRDTVEARNLARVADLSIEQEESKLSGNMLWSVLVNFLTTNPNRKQEVQIDGEDGEAAGYRQVRDAKKHSKILRRLTSFGKKHPGDPEGNPA